MAQNMGTPSKLLSPKHLKSTYYISFINICRYGQSKLAQIYFTQELAKRFENIGVYSLHPGMVNTNIFRYTKLQFGNIGALIAVIFSRVFGKSPKEGAQTSIFCCVDESLQNPKTSGSYYVDCKRVELKPWLMDERRQEVLWNISRKLVKFEENYHSP